MPDEDSHERRSPEDPSLVPSDHFLLQSMLGGDESALRKLMERYDSLVRFSAFRASGKRSQQDPQWLDSVVSATWVGLVRSLQRDPGRLPDSLPAYLVRIARNQTISALRGGLSGMEAAVVDLSDEAGEVAGEADSPVDTISRLEDLESLRRCIGELDGDDRTLASQFPAMTQRRWTEAAETLGVTESTLRYRWQRLLERLKRCMEKKTGGDFARGRIMSDNQDVGEDCAEE